MTTKRERSPSASDDAPPAKRVETETLSDIGLPHSEEMATVPIMANSSAVEDVTTVEQQSEAMLAAMGLLVVAPELQCVHDSWEAFELALKEYAKATYQLYVIRSTTSVKRRNLKIAESAARDAVGSHAELLRNVGLAGDESNGEQTTERSLIPEQFQWYSKSLKCTHGWKDRHRGTGKRGSGVVRSTSCPAKMCVTLQHRGEEWKVVVTKHVRTHNHQLSKELYLYYTENRRIYDPELLAVVGDGYAEAGAATASQHLVNAHLTTLIDQRAGLYRMLTSAEDGIAQSQQAASMAFMVSESASSSSVSRNTTNNQFVALSDANSSNFVIRPRISAGAQLAVMPPLGTLILTPGTVPSKAMHGGGFCVPRIAVKVHSSWDAFHEFLAQYSFDTAQVFRTRSTVSVASRNAKILASVAAKAAVDGSDVASYSSYAAASPTSRLIPEEHKWFSKLLICTFGWKRRARIKSSHAAGENDAGPCPAMLLARMERNVDGEWNVVINRQVQEHNHRLSNHVEEVTHSSAGEATGALVMAPPVDSIQTQPSQSTDTAVELESGPIATETSIANLAVLAAEHREIVVRVPKLQSVFSSWDDFHASLKTYSDATYQLYRTRTTSSAAGRNKKMAQMKRGGYGENDGSNGCTSDPDAYLSGAQSTRKIPVSWRWYSKTLTCTHGWKERNRGTGKRSAHNVRSTACPVKICATVQYTNPISGLENGTESVENNSENCWRVVVTKHVVDHNHNLSHELYQHYCENRRIYDPELLAIDVSNESAVVKQKLYQGSDPGTIADGVSMMSQPSVLSDAGLAEVVNHVQLFDNHAVEIGDNGAASMQPSSAGMSTETQQIIPSVVLLPYSTPSAYVSQASAHQQQQEQEHENQRQQQQDLAQAELAAISAATQLQKEATGADGGALEATSANISILSNAKSGGVSQSGSNVISVACRVHGSSSSTTTSANEPANSSTALCTCFRIAGGSNYVAIVPASEPLAPVETGFDVADEALLYAEVTEGVWTPSSNVVIEKVTTENGEMVWRVPRLIHRYTTWNNFHKYLDAYSAATFQLYRVRTTYSVRSRNTRLRQIAASRGLAVREGEDDNSVRTEQGVHGLSRAHLVPERYEWYSKTFLCTHGWKRRSRGSGQRVSHNVRATECPAKICATLQRTDGATNWSVIVTKHLTEHNHEISEVIYHQYSEVRRVKDPAVLAQAEQLWRSGATRRRVFEFLKERSPNHVILMKDVHNLVQRWQSQERRPQLDNQQDGDEQEPRQSSPPIVTGDESASWL